MLKQNFKICLLVGLYTSNVIAYTASEDVLLSTKNFHVSGTFSHYDFTGVNDAFDWIFTTTQNVSYQLHGSIYTTDNVFGWKKVDNIGAAEPAWYMFSLGSDVDGDGTTKFDWILLSANQNTNAAYKLSGVSEQGTFQYSNKLDISYSVNNNIVTISENYMSTATSDESCKLLSQQVLNFYYALDVQMPESKNIYDAVKSAGTNANCKTVEGLVYYFGPDFYDYGYDQDYAKAKKLFEIAADKGSLIGYTVLGMMYYSGNGVVIDYDKVKQYYKFASEHEEHNAQYMYGMMYHEGTGVIKNDVIAKRWFEKSALNNNALAQNALGELYQNSPDVKTDYLKSKELYEQALDGGNYDAGTNLGILYRDGLGVHKDLQVANDYLKDAAIFGNDRAQAYLGYAYLYGLGVDQNYMEAVKLFELAIEQNNALAYAYLGSMYYKGQGVLKDIKKAEEYLNIALEMGDKWATQFLQDNRF